MLRSALFIALFLAAKSPFFAQQTPYLSFYRHNWQLVNPAAMDPAFYFTRQHNVLMISANARKQWAFSGIDGAPQQAFFSAEYSPEVSRRASNTFKAGVTYFADQTDVFKTNAAYLNYSYAIALPATRGHYLHFGFSPGFVSTSLDRAALNLVDPDDQTVSNFEGKKQIHVPVGVFYRQGKGFYMGFSMPKGLGINLNSPAVKGRRRIWAADQEPHFCAVFGNFFQAGAYDYRRQSDNQFWLIEPSVWLRWTPGTAYATLIPRWPVGMDFNVRAFYRGQYWAGIGYGSNAAIDAEFGTQIELEGSQNIRLGFTWSYPVGSRYLRLGQTFELMVSAGWD